MKNNCRDCKHIFRDEESWEMPHIYTYVCCARPSMSGLKSFPFKETDCASFEKATTRLKPSLSEALKMLDWGGKE